MSILHEPSINVFLDEFDSLVSSSSQQLALVYAGATCQSTGQWLLSDNVLKPHLLLDRVEALADKKVQPLVGDFLWLFMISDILFPTIHYFCLGRSGERRNPSPY